MIKGIIFDLDNCIFDTRSMGESIINPIISAMKNDREFALSDAFRKAARGLWSMSSEEVIRINNIPSKIADAMRAAYGGLEVPGYSHNYDDAGHITKLHLKKILVTSGYRNFQLSKVRKTGIESYFDEIIIDAIDDPAAVKGKRKIFEEITGKYGWKNREVLIIGDSPVSELAAGKELGMVTVQILRPGVTRADGFDHYIESLIDLDGIIKKYQ